MFAMLTGLADGARDIRSFIRRQPFDRTNADDRARERHVRVALGASASLLAKVVSVGTVLISVPLTLHYLGPERYGMWMTMSSLVAIFSFADLGIGNGVLNAVAAAHGRDDRATIRGYVSSGFFRTLGRCTSAHRRIRASLSVRSMVQDIQCRNGGGARRGRSRSWHPGRLFRPRHSGRYRPARADRTAARLHREPLAMRE